MKVENKISANPVVYALSDPRNPRIPRYIGRTISHVRQRLYTHLVASYNAPNDPLHKWILELEGLGMLPRVMVYEICTAETIRQREEFWIVFFRRSGWLLNKSNGSGNGSGHRPSEANIAATIARNKRGWSEATRIKQIAARKGKKWSEDRKRKWMRSTRVVANTQMAIQMGKEISKKNKKQVRCIETGVVFQSVRECIKALNGNQPWFNEMMRRGSAYKGFHYQIISTRNTPCLL